MWHSLISGLLLGWGACIPLGPMNIEIIRRHLSYGFRYGFAFGSGSVLSDLTYFVIVYLGLIELLSDHRVMRWIGYVSIAALLYFAFSALLNKPNISIDNANSKNRSKLSIWMNGFIGYGYTLINPYTLIFWVAVGAQLAELQATGTGDLFALGLGVVLSTFSWVVGLNVVLHYIKRHISLKWMRRINAIGALCLFAFIAIIAYELWVKRVLG